MAGTSFREYEYGADFENQTKSDITIGGEVLVEERHRREEVERCWWGRDMERGGSTAQNFVSIQ